MIVKKVIGICGGGTGGHIRPALNITKRLLEKRTDLQAVYFGAANSLEERLAREAGYEFLPVKTIMLHRPALSLKNVKLPLTVLTGVNQARGLLKKNSVEFVIGTGGYSSFPVLAAAKLLKIPYVINEQNAYPGLVNRLMASGARRIYIGFDDAKTHLKADSHNIILTGNPIATASENISKDKARTFFGLETGHPTIFITGGSGGSRKINQTIEAIYPGLIAEGYNIIWQVGNSPMAYSDTTDVEAPMSPYLVKKRFFTAEEMAHAFAAANLGITRCGAMTLGELAEAGLPAILIPFPYSAEGHQEANALAFENAGAAKMILDGDLNTDTLKKNIVDITKQNKLEQMGAAMRKSARSNATEEIVNDIMAIL